MPKIKLRFALPVLYFVLIFVAMLTYSSFYLSSINDRQNIFLNSNLDKTINQSKNLFENRTFDEIVSDRELLDKFIHTTLYDIFIADGSRIVYHLNNDYVGMNYTEAYSITSENMRTLPFDDSVYELVITVKNEIYSQLKHESYNNTVSLIILVLMLSFAFGYISYLIINIMLNVVKVIDHNGRLPKSIFFEVDILNSNLNYILDGLDNQRRVLLDASSNGQVFIDSQSRIISYNKKSKVLFGDLSEGKYLSDILKVTEFKNLRSYLTIYGLDRNHHEEIQYNNRSYEVNMYMVSEDRYMLNIIDVTIHHQKKIDAYYNAKTSSVSEILAIISHQWRQPLNLISSANMMIKLDMEMSGTIDKKAFKKHQDNIDESVEYLDKTIEDFRTFFKNNTSRVNVKVEDIMKTSINLLSNLISENHISIDIKYHNIDRDENILIYNSQLNQVILNILNNAIYVIGNSEIKNPFINIELQKKNDNLHLVIEDSGGGMTPDVLGKVFEPYFSTKSNIGRGLGLYMSKIIVESQLNGTIGVVNGEAGARFSIVIPY